MLDGEWSDRVLDGRWGDRVYGRRWLLPACIALLVAVLLVTKGAWWAVIIVCPLLFVLVVAPAVLDLAATFKGSQSEEPK
jgi:hypothetical protein